jgi:uncharacterized coiled-coil protein SlyX
MEEKEIKPGEEPEKTIEDEAKDMGWRPKEDYSGDDTKWIEPREFVERKPLYDRIHKLEQNNKRQSQTIHEVNDHISKVRKSEYERAMVDLEVKKKHAVESADSDEVRKVDHQIDNLKTQIPPAKNPLHPAIEEFIDDNEGWWKNEEMQDYAIARHDRVMQESNVDMESGLKKVLQDVKTRFPEQFENGNRYQPSAVEGGRRSGKSSKSRFTPSDLSEAQRAIGDRWVRSGAMKSMQQYVDELHKVGEIK